MRERERERERESEREKKKETRKNTKLYIYIYRITRRTPKLMKPPNPSDIKQNCEPHFGARWWRAFLGRAWQCSLNGLNPLSSAPIHGVIPRIITYGHAIRTGYGWTAWTASHPNSINSCIMLYHHQSIERRTFFTGKLSPSLCLPTPIPLCHRVHLSTIFCVSTALVTLSLYLHFRMFLSHHWAICLPTCLLTMGLSSFSLPKLPCWRYIGIPRM